MAKKIKAVLHEPHCGWYLIRFEDDSVKETYRVYKYVEKFMMDHEAKQLTGLRFGYYAKEERT